LPVCNILIAVITTTNRIVFKLSDYSYGRILDYNQSQLNYHYNITGSATYKISKQLV